MKLPISVLVLAALHAASMESAAKSLKKNNTQTNKRELFEGNFGEKKEGFLPKFVSSGSSPGIQYAEDHKEELSDQSPANHVFGARLPHIAKISDLLTGQGPPFEVAVANHLYAPVSVYQARLSSPTTFEIPSPAASQIAFSNPKTYKPSKLEDDQKAPEPSSKEEEDPRLNPNNVPVFAVKQPRFRFESYPQPFALGLPRHQNNQQGFKQGPAPQLFPLYDELGPNRYPGYVLPSRFLQQHGLVKLVPVDSGVDFMYMDDNRGEQHNGNQESHEELKAVATERPQLQREIPQSIQGYHAHPNGAISFASFSQNLPSNSQPEPAPQPQPDQTHNQQQTEQSSQIQSQYPQSSLQSQNENQQSTKQNLPFPSMLRQYVQQFHSETQQQLRFQNVPESQPQIHFMTFKHPMRPQIRNYNPLRQQLLIEGPYQTLQSIQFQRFPAFKPLPQSQLTSETLYQATTTSPLSEESQPNFKSIPHPRTYGYQGPLTQNPIHFNQHLAPVLPQRHLTPLPPLKPNYSQSVKPLNHRPLPAFLPTPVQPTSTPKSQPASDQLISSTTIQPIIKSHENDREQLIEEQSQTPKPLEPEITYQSQPNVLPLSIQSTTNQPSTTYEAQFEQVQHSTPQPQFQPTVHPQPIQSPPRHEVVIQQQELKELILEPSPQLLSTPFYEPLHHQNQFHQQEEHDYQSQQHQHELKQLYPLLYQQVAQELRTQNHQRDARQREEKSQSPKLKHGTQIEPQQYQNRPPSKQGKHQFQILQIESQAPEQIQSQDEEQGTQQIELKKYHHQQPQNEIQTEVSTPQPSEEPQTTPEPQSEHQQQTGPKPQHQIESQPTTVEPNEQPEHANTPSEPKLPTLHPGEPFFGLNYPDFPQIYGQPQELLVQPEFSSPLGISSVPDVQYFGKFAESLFGGLHHRRIV